MRDDSDLDLLLSNYLAGRLPAGEREAFERRLAQDPMLAREVVLARRICEWPSGPAEAGDADAVWARLRTVVAAPPVPARKVRSIPWQAAAAVVLALGTGLLWRALGPLTPQTPAAAPLREYVAKQGEWVSFRLPDGTQVMLGPASRLRSTVAPDRGPRTVTLDGEAYFVVRHDADRPFTVHTPRGVARDLGTRFTVQAYPGDSAVDVVVAEGVVSLAASAGERDSLVLAAGALGHVTAAGRLTAELGVPLGRYLAWTEGRLEFRGTPLSEAVVRLGRWYDLDVRLADPELGRTRLAASFKDESATEALQVIAATAGLRLERRGAVVIFHKSK